MSFEFISRVYRISMAAWLLALLLCLAAGSLPAALGLTVGFWSSLGSLYVLQLTVQRLFVPSRVSQFRRVRWSVLGLATAKYALIGGLVYVSLRVGRASAPALAVGIGLPQMVIFLKAVGLALTPGGARGRG